MNDLINIVNGKRDEINLYEDMNKAINSTVLKNQKDLNNNFSSIGDAIKESMRRSKEALTNKELKKLVIKIVDDICADNPPKFRTLKRKNLTSTYTKENGVKFNVGEREVTDLFFLESGYTVDEVKEFFFMMGKSIRRKLVAVNTGNCNIAPFGDMQDYKDVDISDDEIKEIEPLS